jgi:GTP-binding protein LepA
MPPGATSRTSHIRNFSIIAHIDHGKSTLSDRILLKTGAIAERDFRNQVLDAMDLERERGITIRMHPVTCYYEVGGQTYELNLIDTPGHVDFSYEVSRSLAACEGVILLVDAFQGVQAQTVANAFLAMESDLKIVPVLNKVDLPVVRPEVVIAEMQQALGIEPADVIRASGKTGLGTDEVLQAIVDRIPAPSGNPDEPLQALVYNSHFDTYKGVVVYVRVMQGTLQKGERIRLMRGSTEHEVIELGQFRPAMTVCERLSAGQVGYFMAQIKTLNDVHIGDTVTDALRPTADALAGYNRWFIAACTRSTTPISNCCAKRWLDFASMTPASRICRRAVKASVSASVAAFWACCTAKSSSSAWSAIVTSTWYRRPPTSHMKS